MENREQDKKANTDHPKPSEEVQLTIETVTPDTIRTVPQTAVDSEKVEQKTEDANENPATSKGDTEEQSVEVKSEETPTETEEAATHDKEADGVEDEANDDSDAEENKEGTSAETDENESTGDNKEDGDDERDKIETIAP